MSRGKCGILEKFCAEYGYHGNYGIPDIAGTYEGKNLLVCGDAACVWDDLERFGCKRLGNHSGRGEVSKQGWDFLTVNKLVETFPGHIEHCYSNQYNLLAKFIDARRYEYRREFPNSPKHVHSISPDSPIRWPLGGHGTSGLGAVLVGVGLGYGRIVLAGIPLDDGPHNGEPPWRGTNFTREASDQVDGNLPMPWLKARKLAFDNKVTSLSGRTKQWLGEPDG